jgi:predicted transcriptional regulator
MTNIPILTPLELKVMDVLWKLKKGFVKDILEHWPDSPAPAYNTISTIVRILQDKKSCIGHTAHGRTHEYIPLISKDEYQKAFISQAVEKVFEGSVSSLLSTLIGNERVSLDELAELRKIIDQSNDTE